MNRTWVPTVWTILSDFDGTILKEDAAEQVLERFAKPRWKDFNGLLAEGKINIEQSVSEQYAMIEAATKKEVLKYVRALYRPRPGLKTLLRVCKGRDAAFVVVSAGIDFCIRDAFSAMQIEMPRLICPKSTFLPRKGLRLSFPRRRYPESRDFKEDAVMYFKARGHRVAYVGDGSGDANAAERADAVFAVEQSALERLCVRRQIPYRPVKTFNPVSAFLSRVASCKRDSPGHTAQRL